MAVVPLIHTQLVPPHIRNSIRRTRLRNLGLSILSHHVTTVVAPAGYGKSVWISSLLEEPDWPPAAWLSLDRHDIEPSFFLYHLIHSIKRVLAGFGSYSLRTMNSLEDAGRDWPIAVSTLIEDIHPKWAAHLLRRWFPRRTCEEMGGLLVYPEESARNHISMLLQDITRETGAPVVHVNCLGCFRVFVNGIEIEPSSWKTKKE